MADMDLIDVEADMAACRERIAALALLGDGWHDGAGRQPAPAAVSAAYCLLALKPAMAGDFSIFPTESGGLLFEFSRRGWDYSVEIGSSGMAEIYGIEIGGDGEMDTAAVDVSSPDFVREFEAVIRGDR